MDAKKRERYLKNVYEHVLDASVRTNSCRYKGIYLDDNWRSFDGFKKDNWIRFYRSLVKWKNYKPFYVKKLKNSYLRFIIKDKNIGYTKGNTVFTSPSDCTKYFDSTHIVMLDDKVLGTRDVKNILLKRGIEAKTGLISERMKTGIDIFKPKEKSKYNYNGEYISLKDIAKNENISLGVLKYYINKNGKSLTESVKLSKGKGMAKIEFEGQYYFKKEVFKILEKRTGINWVTIKHRYKKHGLNIENLSSTIHGNYKNGEYAKLQS